MVETRSSTATIFTSTEKIKEDFLAVLQQHSSSTIGLFLLSRALDQHSFGVASNVYYARSGVIHCNEYHFSSFYMSTVCQVEC
jgi:hypothetical protein